MQNERRIVESLLNETSLRTVTPERNPEDGSSPGHLRWMLEELLATMDHQTTDKVNRWIGFIQGALVARGITSVNTERERVRKAAI